MTDFKWQNRRRIAAFVAVWAAAGLAIPGVSRSEEPVLGRVVVGSKNFTEGYVLAEIVAQQLERDGFKVERRFGLGGTLVCYQALLGGEIDVYPEYSGTVEKAILHLDGRRSYDDLRALLRRDGRVDLLPTFGFNNTYAMAVRRRMADSLGLDTIGDLARYPGLHISFSHEFLSRSDGWPGLAARYALAQSPGGIEHGLAYPAIARGKIDVTDVYSTDGDVEKYGLALLTDDDGYFPVYLAGPLVRSDLGASARRSLSRLAGTLDEAAMRALNARVLLDGESFSGVAASFLDDLSGGAGRTPVRRSLRWDTLARRTLRHVELTVLALIAAILVAVPMGIAAFWSRRLARPVVYAAGALQTVPSIALLAFMIPLFGIGAKPAVVALFLYALLPIVRNTTTALLTIDPLLRKVAVGMGLTARERLRHVEMPLAMPTILAGVKTAAVINIGTATLAAFIGAGGLGEPIVTGLALNDTGLILEGAIPAAVLAVLAELVFECIERASFPPHLREPGAGVGHVGG